MHINVKFVMPVYVNYKITKNASTKNVLYVNERERVNLEQLFTQFETFMTFCFI